MHRRSFAAALALAGLVMVAMACDGGDDETVTRPNRRSMSCRRRRTAARVSDGVLRMGLLTPSAGEGAAIGQSLEESAAPPSTSSTPPVASRVSPST